MANNFALSQKQIVEAILANRSDACHVVGHMGTGKSYLLKMLGERLPNHTLCYFDCTTKTMGDVSMPQFNKIDENGYVTFVPNEELGLHLSKPLVVMVDELPKGETGVVRSMTRFMYEGKIGTFNSHPDSIRFSTGNLDAEGVGDSLLPTMYNRVTTLEMRKPNNVETIEFGINNGFHPILLSVMKDKPEYFADFRDFQYKDNAYPYHPDDLNRRAFVSNRSLHRASNWLHASDKIDETTLYAALIGTVGGPAAADIMTYSKMIGDLPSLDSIKSNPHTAKIPKSAEVRVMVVYRTMQNIDATWVDAWMEYFERLDPEIQGYFKNGITAYSFDKKKQKVVMTNAKYTKWAMANTHLSTTDKK